ncbi:MAG TPA: DUF427 domain-containing protein [Arthrobacter sp.]
MATKISTMLAQLFPELRYQPTRKRIRASLGTAAVLDSTRAVLFWEPKRVVPGYAVPAEDVAASLAPTTAPDAAPGGALGGAGGTAGPDPHQRPVLPPDVPFPVHSTDGESLDVTAGGVTARQAAFRPADPELSGYIAFDFAAFSWLEEDEPIMSHPRDPFHRVDMRRSSRNVQISADGRILAESDHPTLVFETNLPTRLYLPRDDVTWSALRPTASITTCAYKGQASYWALAAVDSTERRDVAWTYTEPLQDSGQLAGLIAFFDERVDVRVDGVAQERPRTPWS